MGKAADKICKEIVATGRAFSKAGLVEGSWGNISARINNKGLVAITPSGRSYDGLSCKDIAIITLDGKVKKAKYKPSSESQLHLAIYDARPDIKAVIHTHSIYASACAVAKVPILPVMEDIVQIVGGQVDVCDYALAGTKELAVNAVSALGSKNAVLLANHGLVSCGRNLKEALTAANIVEKTAMIMIFAKQLNPDLQALDDDDIKKLRKFYLKQYSKIQMVE